ncbi:MAG TPA: lysophospholipid acyltransferase family protein [Sphingomicrobium sp.]|jgi:1-acyl-sn-glycerol-3-phosphate acyltransferase
MAALRSLIYAVVFYPATILLCIIGLGGGLFAQRPMLAAVRAWADLNNWLARRVLGIRVRVEGQVPAGAYLVAVKHESMFETLEMVRLTNVPVIVIKRELANIPLFGWMTRRYGIIAVDREAGTKALRALVEQGRKAVASGRGIIIYPEGTRVPHGETPPLKSGFAALYRALNLPVVPVAMDSGRLWGRGFVHQGGTINFKIGEVIPAGLPRKEVEARVHTAINLLVSGAEPGA